MTPAGIDKCARAEQLSQACIQPRRRVRVCPDAARVARCHHRPTNNKPQGLS
jgi:hypothetical protein